MDNRIRSIVLFIVVFAITISFVVYMKGQGHFKQSGTINTTDGLTVKCDKLIKRGATAECDGVDYSYTYIKTLTRD